MDKGKGLNELFKDIAVALQPVIAEVIAENRIVERWELDCAECEVCSKCVACDDCEHLSCADCGDPNAEDLKGFNGVLKCVECLPE